MSEITKEHVNAFEYANEIMAALQKGVLLTSKADGKLNSMTIAWGTLGIEFSKPLFITFVRKGRFTHELLAKNPEFTINIPVGAFDRKILGICGSKSGRDMDKIAAAGLTPVEPEVISVPGFKELPLTLECKVVYSQKQDLDRLYTPYRESCYPADVPGTFPMANRDAHTAFYGEIVSSYIIKG